MSDATSKPDLPAEIGGYRIQRVLGTGGMATVYAALQQRPRRTVALKVLRADIDTPQALRRFKREAEILGRLRHAGIAQIYEAGTHVEAGQTTPYFVMEYVPGARTILQFVAQHELDIRARLKLFVKVCAAVQHGHRNKVIHRDLKPGNILIDRGGNPKVIDFGIARVGEIDLQAQTMHTEVGRLVGTIQYMSPEQLETKPIDLDSRCDVYALGTLLYKLLTARLPHDLEELPVYAAAEVIRNETPRPPSAHRPELAGDLETIVLKALEKDRARRYEDAGSLGRDIVRYLGDNPIHARRAGAIYRARLFARRHRSAVVAGAIVLAVMGVALAVVAWDRGRPRTDDGVRAQLEQTERERAELEAALRTRRPASDPTALPAFDPFTLKGHTAAIRTMCFDASGTQLLSGGGDRVVIRWDLVEREPIFTETGHNAPVTAVAVNDDGTQVATAAADGAIIMLDESGIWSWYDLTACDSIRALDLAPRGDRVIFGCRDLTLRSRNFATDREDTQRLPVGAFSAVSYAHDGGMAAGGTERGVGFVWTWNSGGVQRHRLDGLTAPIVAIGFTPDDSRVVAIAADGSAMVWNPVNESSEGRPFTAMSDAVVAADFDPTGRWLVCGTTDRIAVWDTTAVERAGALIEHEPGIAALAIAPDGRTLAIGEPSGRISVKQRPR